MLRQKGNSVAISSRVSRSRQTSGRIANRIFTPRYAAVPRAVNGTNSENILAVTCTKVQYRRRPHTWSPHARGAFAARTKIHPPNAANLHHLGVRRLAAAFTRRSSLRRLLRDPTLSTARLYDFRPIPLSLHCAKSNRRPRPTLATLSPARNSRPLTRAVRAAHGSKAAA